jgi:uncharacterized protein
VEYRRRYLDDELDELMEPPFAIAIDGPKGVGKTATAARRADVVLRLDEEPVRQLVGADPARLLADRGVVLLDEWQLLPMVWDRVRRGVDESAQASFLLTGSATPLPDADRHSGAGRILSLRLRPMSLPERGVTESTVTIARLLTGAAEISGRTTWGLSDYAREICASGFPGIHGLPARRQRAQLDGYLAHVVDRDIAGLGVALRHPDTLRRWLTAYAAASSTSASYTTILDAASAGDARKPAKTTTIAYRDLLTQIWVLDPVPPWLPRGAELSRLKTAPKHQLADPALAARLLQHTPETLLAPRAGSAELLGHLLESLATLTVRAAAQAQEASVGHLRTRDGGHEVDLVVERNDGRVVAFEVKLAASVSDSDVRHLRWLADQLGDRLADMVVITTGPDAYRRPDGVAVVPLALLG